MGRGRATREAKRAEADERLRGPITRIHGVRTAETERLAQLPPSVTGLPDQPWWVVVRAERADLPALCEAALLSFCAAFWPLDRRLIEAGVLGSAIVPGAFFFGLHTQTAEEAAERAVTWVSRQQRDCTIQTAPDGAVDVCRHRHFAPFRERVQSLLMRAAPLRAPGDAETIDIADDGALAKLGARCGSTVEGCELMDTLTRLGRCFGRVTVTEGAVRAVEA